MTANSPADVAAQYATDDNLRVRIETHERYGVGPDLESAVDRLLNLRGDEALLDVGTGPGDFPGRLRMGGHRGHLVGADLSQGMVEKARAAYPTASFVRADAATLPFPDESFDVLTARHMLYHVPDVPAALTEFRRVLRRGGRFLALTNASDYMKELWAVVAEAAEGEPALNTMRGSRASFAANFSEVNGAEQVRDVFGNAKVEFLESALVFPDAEPVLAYLASIPTAQNLAEADRARGFTTLRSVLAPRFQHGPWHVSKRLAFILAERS